MPNGEVGEILVRPKRPFAMLTAYYNDPEATAGAFRNLWFHTGDNARVDADGYFYFVDRKKDAIRRRGENISSSEVEAVLNKHPAILECAVVAEPSELGEDEVKAVVVLRDGAAVHAEELWAFAEQHMPRFWVPRYIEFRSEMPKTPSQKIQKYLLRAGDGPGGILDRRTRARRQPMTSATIKVYTDYKSPYAYLAKDLVYDLERETGAVIDWLPYTLDIPAYLGSARLNADGTVLEESRNAHQWRRVKYSYMDCRREANLTRPHHPRNAENLGLLAGQHRPSLCEAAGRAARLPRRRFRAVLAA